MVSPQPKQTITFLNALYPEPLESPHAFGYGGLRYSKWADVNSSGFEVIADDVSSLAKKGDVYFQVCTHNPQKVGRSGRGNKGSCLFVPAVYLDLDVAEKPNKKPQHNYPPREVALDFLLGGTCPLQPSVVVDSGSGGFHAYWLLKEPVLYDDKMIKDWQTVCGNHLGYDVDFTNKASVILRMPGTIHHTHGTPVKLSYIDESIRYEPSQFYEVIEKTLPKTSMLLKTSISFSQTSHEKTRREKLEPDENAPTILRRAGLESYVHEPTVMLMLARRVLCLDTSKLYVRGDSLTFCCILPDHEEQEPSASIFWGEKDAIIYKDFHRNNEAFSLATVYASQHYGEVKKLTSTEQATWLIRMMVEGGLIPPAVVNAPLLPDDAPASAKTIYSGFTRLLECRGHYSPDTPAAFAYDFAMAWCSASRRAVNEGLKWLKGRGYLVRTKEHLCHGRATGLYELGTNQTIMKVIPENYLTKSHQHKVLNKRRRK